MRKLYLGLGSNQGDRWAHLGAAAARLATCPGVAVLRRSSVYGSPPLGPAQPDFLNAALEVATALAPADLLAACKEIERALGRVPGLRWGPRPIDLDLLLADEIVALPQLQVPHLELHRRAFALMPLCELAPEAVHPVLGRRLADLLADLGSQGVERVGALPADG